MGLRSPGVAAAAVAVVRRRRRRRRGHTSQNQSPHVSQGAHVDLSEQILRLHVLRHRWRGWHGLCGHRGSVERGACSRAGDALVLGGYQPQ